MFKFVHQPEVHFSDSHFFPLSSSPKRLIFTHSSSGIQLVFLRKVVRQKCAALTSFCMQFEKVECGLLREAFRSERECYVPRPTFSHCMQSDVTSVCFCLMTFCKKTIVYYSSLFPSPRKKRNCATHMCVCYNNPFSYFIKI